MRIKQLAEAAEVPVDTVRHYEKAGLLGAPQRSDNGYRVYLTSDLDRLRFIRHCRDLDMSLDEVRELLQFVDHDSPDCQAADAVVQTHLRHVRERLSALRRLERQLVQLVGACQHPCPQERCGIMQALAAPDAASRVRRTPARGVHSS
jgi:DNA-binding transcriptional MerR regulator